MHKHEIKTCPRCGVQFECKVGAVMLCQCSAIELNEAESAYIRSKFEDCLCIHCLWELKAAYHRELKAKNCDA